MVRNRPQVLSTIKSEQLKIPYGRRVILESVHGSTILGARDKVVNKTQDTCSYEKLKKYNKNATDILAVFLYSISCLVENNYTYIHTYIYIYVCVCVYTHVCMHTHTHALTVV